MKPHFSVLTLHTAGWFLSHGSQFRPWHSLVSLHQHQWRLVEKNEKYLSHPEDARFFPETWDVKRWSQLSPDTALNSFLVRLRLREEQSVLWLKVVVFCTINSVSAWQHPVTVSEIWISFLAWENSQCFFPVFNKNQNTAAWKCLLQVCKNKTRLQTDTSWN